MPRLWRTTVDAHRADVREAILGSTGQLAAEVGLRAVTMSRIAEVTGIGRATLYKYFPNVDAILQALHHQQITEHLSQLQALADQPGEPLQRLESVLRAYALICRQRQRHDSQELPAPSHRGGTVHPAGLHHGEPVRQAERRVQDLLTGLIEQGVAAGTVRDDAAGGVLASYCLHALTAAGDLKSHAATQQLVMVTLAGLRPRP